MLSDAQSSALSMRLNLFVWEIQLLISYLSLVYNFDIFHYKFLEDINMNDIEIRVGFENPLYGSPKDLNSFCSNSFRDDIYMMDYYSKFNIKKHIISLYGMIFISFFCWNGPYLGKFITIQKSSGPLDLFEVTIDPAPSKLV